MTLVKVLDSFIVKDVDEKVLLLPAGQAQRDALLNNKSYNRMSPGSQMLTNALSNFKVLNSEGPVVEQKVMTDVRLAAESGTQCVSYTWACFMTAMPPQSGTCGHRGSQ